MFVTVCIGLYEISNSEIFIVAKLILKCSEFKLLCDTFKYCRFGNNCNTSLTSLVSKDPSDRSKRSIARPGKCLKIAIALNGFVMYRQFNFLAIGLFDISKPFIGCN